ncbi:MAG: antibiotic biosynthesis monooxygenase [Rhodobacteraceae bacterium]|nr:antibiotic biosynthesis monooxygenase [Paracoccaceae bacterium]
MHTLTAILRAKPGHEDAVKAALLRVGAYVRANERDTLGFFVAQDEGDPCRFTTYERFTDRAAMDRHNNGDGSKGFFAEAGHLLDGPATIVTAVEVFER